MYTFLFLFFSHFYLLFLTNNGNKERLADKDFILLLFVTLFRFFKMISLVNFEDDFACAAVLYVMPFYQQKVTAACLDFPI